LSLSGNSHLRGAFVGRGPVWKSGLRFSSVRCLPAFCWGHRGPQIVWGVPMDSWGTATPARGAPKMLGGGLRAFRGMLAEKGALSKQRGGCVCISARASAQTPLSAPKQRARSWWHSHGPPLGGGVLRGSFPGRRKKSAMNGPGGVPPAGITGFTRSGLGSGRDQNCGEAGLGSHPTPEFLKNVRENSVPH